MSSLFQLLKAYSQPMFTFLSPSGNKGLLILLALVGPRQSPVLRTRSHHGGALVMQGRPGTPALPNGQGPTPLSIPDPQDGSDHDSLSSLRLSSDAFNNCSKWECIEQLSLNIYPFI